MQLAAALTEFAYAKDHTPTSRAWYTSHLGAFTAWAAAQGVDTVEDVTTSLVRRYVDERRTTPSKTGRPLDSHTLHGHVRAIRAFLHWAADEDLIDERIPKRVALPKKEQKVLAIFTPAQVDALVTPAWAAYFPRRGGN